VNAPVAHTTLAAPIAPSESATDPGTQYAALLDRYAQIQRAHSAALAELALAERTLPGAVFSHDADHIDAAVRDANKRITATLLAHAQKHFSTAGVRLSLDLGAARDTLGDLDACAPAHLWSYLEATYGSGRGETFAYGQTASLLAETFRLRADAAPAMVGGAMVLGLRVYCDSFDKKYSNRNRLHYSASESVVQALQAVAVVAEWAQRGQLADDLYSLSREIGYRYEVVSRRSTSLGDNDARLVEYLERFELRLMPAFAEQFMVFMSTFGVGAMQAQAERSSRW
jgi:hypothetical protein